MTAEAAYDSTDGRWYVDVDSSHVDGPYSRLAAEVAASRWGTSAQQTGSTLVLTSSNGTSFTFKVSDDGNLVASPIGVTVTSVDQNEILADDLYDIDGNAIGAPVTFHGTHLKAAFSWFFVKHGVDPAVMFGDPPYPVNGFFNIYGPSEDGTSATALFTVGLNDGEPYTDTAGVYDIYSYDNTNEQVAHLANAITVTEGA